MARPRKSVALKALEGDTRQRGANKHAALISRAFQAERGEPPFPPELRPRRMPPELDAERAALHIAAESRRACAKSHYEYLVDQLTIDGLLCTLDQGILLGAAWAYALMNEAADLGKSKDFTELYAKYMQAADRIGLDEVARAKFDHLTREKTSPTQSQMATFLRNRKSADESGTLN